MLTLEAPRIKMHLKMSSAEVVCCKYLPSIIEELSIEANSVDPEADHFCCDWRIKG